MLDLTKEEIKEEKKSLSFVKKTVKGIVAFFITSFVCIFALTPFMPDVEVTSTQYNELEMKYNEKLEELKVAEQNNTDKVQEITNKKEQLVKEQENLKNQIETINSSIDKLKN